MEPRVPVVMPRQMIEPQVTPRRVRKPRAPVMMPPVPVRMPEALVELPLALAEVAPEAVCAMRRPPARVCRSSISP